MSELNRTAFAVKGDVNDVRRAVLGGTEDLSTATAFEAHVWLGEGRRHQAANLVATLVDAVARIVAVNFGPVSGWLSDADPLRWNAEVEVTWGDGTIITYPSPPGEAFVSVREQGDPGP